MAGPDPFNEQAFEKLFKEYFPYLCAFARKYVTDHDVSKDLVHNVFLSLWQKKDAIDTSIPLKSYLFKAVHNRCLNHLRDQKRIVRHDLPQDPEAVPGFVESPNYLEQSELQSLIKKAIDGLPEKCQRIFILNRFEEKKYSEIAIIEGVSVKAIEAQMSKALKLLREQLIDYLVLLIFLSILMIGS